MWVQSKKPLDLLQQQTVVLARKILLDRLSLEGLFEGESGPTWGCPWKAAPTPALDQRRGKPRR